LTVYISECNDVLPSELIESAQKNLSAKQDASLITNTHFIPHSLDWTINMLHWGQDARRLACLRTWTHPRRLHKATPEMVLKIASLSREQARLALYELRIRRRYTIRNTATQLNAPVTIGPADRWMSLQALIDSGCKGSCINWRLVRKHKIPTRKSPIEIPIYNADGRPNAQQVITHFVVTKLTINGHDERITLAVADLGETDIYLGHDWLVKHNPNINWRTGEIKFPSPDLGSDPDEEGSRETDLQPDEVIIGVDYTEALHICSKSTKSTQLAMANQEKKNLTQSLPHYLSAFSSVFEEKEFDKLPPHRPWDHAIELQPGKEHKLNCKIYSTRCLEKSKTSSISSWTNSYTPDESDH
jgi:hypothetical protein